MALLFANSFDYIDDNIGNNLDDVMFDIAAGAGLEGYDLARCLGYNTVTFLNGNDDFTITTGSSDSTCILQGLIFVYPSSNQIPTTSARLILRDASDDTNQVILEFRHANYGQRYQIRVRNGADTLTLGVSKFLPATSYAHIQIKVVSHASTGTVLVKIDGETVLNLANLNTDPKASGLLDRIHYDYNNTPVYLQSLVIMDSTGTANNDMTTGLLGVECSRPNLDGFYEQWTLSTGTDTHHLVGDGYLFSQSYSTVWIETATSNNRSSWECEDLATGKDTIYGVVQYLEAHTDTGSNTLDVFTRQQNSDNDQNAGFGATTTARAFWHVMENDPDSGTAWTETTYNAAEFGVRLVP